MTRSVDTLFYTLTTLLFFTFKLFPFESFETVGNSANYILATQPISLSMNLLATYLSSSIFPFHSYLWYLSI